MHSATQRCRLDFRGETGFALESGGSGRYRGPLLLAGAEARPSEKLFGTIEVVPFHEAWVRAMS